MSTPDQPNHPGETPRYPAGQEPGAPRDPYAPGPPSGPTAHLGGQPGYPAPGQGGNPGGNSDGAPGGPSSYPGQPTYPGPSQYPPSQYPPSQYPPGQYQQPNPYQAQNPYPGQGGYPGQQPPGYPAGQGGPPGYPGGPAGYPGYPGYGGGPTTEPVRPVTVTAAFWCWIAVVAAWAISLIFVLTSSTWDQALAAAARQANASSTSNVVLDAQSLINAIRVIAMVGFVIFAGLYLLFAFKMNAGRNWARITLTVLGILGVLGSITPTSRSITVNGEVYASSSGPGWITAVLTVAALVLMFVGGANEFFTSSKAYRSQLR